MTPRSQPAPLNGVSRRKPCCADWTGKLAEGQLARTPKQVRIALLVPRQQRSIRPIPLQGKSHVSGAGYRRQMADQTTGKAAIGIGIAFVPGPSVYATKVVRQGLGTRQSLTPARIWKA
jgi:hypothetical protein